MGTTTFQTFDGFLKGASGVGVGAWMMGVAVTAGATKGIFMATKYSF